MRGLSSWFQQASTTTNSRNTTSWCYRQDSQSRTNWFWQHSAGWLRYLAIQLHCCETVCLKNLMSCSCSVLCWVFSFTLYFPGNYFFTRKHLVLTCELFLNFNMFYCMYNSFVCGNTTKLLYVLSPCKHTKNLCFTVLCMLVLCFILYFG